MLLKCCVHTSVSMADWRQFVLQPMETIGNWLASTGETVQQDSYRDRQSIHRRHKKRRRRNQSIEKKEEGIYKIRETCPTLKDKKARNTLNAWIEWLCLSFSPTIVSFVLHIDISIMIEQVIFNYSFTFLMCVSFWIYIHYNVIICEYWVYTR